MTGNEIKEVETDAAVLWKRGATIEALLAFLRERGLNQPRSRDALVTVTGIDDGHAQIAVLESETWKDQYERNLLIQEELEQALFQLTKEQDLDVKLVLSEEGEKSPLDSKEILHRRSSDN